MALPASASAADPDLVAAYGMEGTAEDLSGTGNDGTVRDPLWAPGKIGKAMRVDRVDGLSRVLTVPDSASLRLTTAMTLEAWVKPEESAAGCGTVTKAIDDTAYSYRLAAGYSGIQSNGEFFGQDTTTYPDVWFHVAIVYDGTSIRVVGNGVEYGTIPAASPIDPGSGPLVIGGEADLSACFTGLIDEVRIYGRALTTEEIARDMVTAVVPDARPSAVTNLAADNSSGTARLTWEAATDDKDVTGYEIHRGDSPDFELYDTTKVATVTGLTYTEGCVQTNTTYYYRVVPLDTLPQQGPASDTVSALIVKPDCPPTPPSVEAKPYNGWVQITLSSGHDERGVTELQLHRSTTQDFTPTAETRIATFAPAPTSYIDYLDTPGTYYYRSLAVDTASQVSEPSPVQSAVVRAAPDLQASLTGAYAFDEGAGATVRDSSPTRHDGALSDGGGFFTLPTWVNGRNGKALSFRGGGFMKASSFYASGQVSISAWVKRTDGQRVIGSFISQGVTDASLLMSSSGGFDGEPTAYTSGHNVNRLKAPAPIPVGVWTHLAVVLDVPSKSYRFYVNGEMVGSRWDYDGHFNGSSGLWVGSGDDHRGLIVDDVRTYSAALTPRQIKTVMDTPIS